MSVTCQSRLSDADLEAFQRDGYLILRGVLDQDYIAECITATQTWIDHQIQAWYDEGLISELYEEEDFRHRFLKAWQAAGEPYYPRSPRKDMIKLEAQRMYDILLNERLLDIAESILGTENIVSHGIFNLRPKAPNQKFTDTPWHQDAQYFREYADVNMVNMWFPMHPVDAKNSCLAFAPGMHRIGLFENDESDIQNGFIGLKPEEAKQLECVPAELNPGDVVIFTNTTPHTAMPNLSDGMRWSWDLRFIDYKDADEWTMELGSVARHQDADQLTKFDAFIEKWQGAEW